MTELSTGTERFWFRSLPSAPSVTDSDRPVTEISVIGHSESCHLNWINTSTVTESDRNVENLALQRNPDSDLGKCTHKRSTGVTMHNFGHFGHCVTSYPQADDRLAVAS